MPVSLVSLVSKQKAGENCLKCFRNCDIKNPFNFWHQSENWFVFRFIDYLTRDLPVKSVTLNLPRQKRFRISYKGEIFDFNNISNEQKDAYLSDKEVVERQSSPGLRHRNFETIKCRYTYIENKENVLKSFDKIKNLEKNEQESFRDLNYQNARRKILGNSKENLQSKPIVIYVHGGKYLIKINLLSMN